MVREKTTTTKKKRDMILSVWIIYERKRIWKKNIITISRFNGRLLLKDADTINKKDY